VAQLQSRHGGQSQVILGRNTFEQGVSGSIVLNVPAGWEIKPSKLPQNRAAARELIRMLMTITVPTNTSLGDVKIRIDFNLTADLKYQFQVYRTIKVGLGDVGMQVFDRKLKDGRLEIEQIITNNIEPGEILNFRCSLFVPDRKRQRRIVTKLGKGRDRKFYYVPDAESLRGKTLWLRAEQINGNRVLNYRWKVLGNETKKKKKAPPATPPASTPGKGGTVPKKTAVPNAAIFQDEPDERVGMRAGGVAMREGRGE